MTPTPKDVDQSIGIALLLLLFIILYVVLFTHIWTFIIVMLFVWAFSTNRDVRELYLILIVRPVRRFFIRLVEEVSSEMRTYDTPKIPNEADYHAIQSVQFFSQTTSSDSGSNENGI